MTAQSRWLPPLVVILAICLACISGPKSVATNPAVESEKKDLAAQRDEINDNSDRMIKEGRETFRYDTFGGEEFWGEPLSLHQAIAGEKNGGVGPRAEAEGALTVGLKVDVGKLPEDPGRRDQAGQRRSRDTRRRRSRFSRPTPSSASRPSSTEDKRITAVGITLRLLPLHRRRLLRARHRPPAGRLAQPRPRRRQDRRAGAQPQALHRPARRRRGDGQEGASAGGPGKYDAELEPGRQGLPPRRQDRRHAASRRLRPGRREPPHLHRLGLRHLLERLRRQHADARQGHVLRPAAQRPGEVPGRRQGRVGNMRDDPDLVTPKLAALHFYQLAIPAPKPPEGLFDAAAAARASRLRRQGGCASATCRPSSPSRAGRCTRPRRSASTTSRRAAPRTSVYRTTPLARPLRAREGRLLPRRPLRRLPGRRRSLRSTLSA